MYPAEFELVVACCRWPPGEGGDAAILRETQGKIDWNRLLRVVRRHRVAGLVHQALTRAKIAIPPQALQALEENARRIVWRNVAALREIGRLHTALSTAGLDGIFFKGPLLGVQAYGLLGLKHGRDIDILVPPRHLLSAIACLEHNGYRLRGTLPENAGVRRKWFAVFKEVELWDAKNKHLVELHWALIENKFLARRLADHMTTREVEATGGIRVTALGTDFAFVYLCVHGASAGWFRLKWLADLAALLAAMSPADLERCLALARECAVEPCVAQALLLCDSLFGLEMAAPAAGSFHRFARYRLLERIALRAMTKGGAETELWAIPFGDTSVTLSRFLLSTSWRYVWAEARLRMANVPDMERFPLPRGLWFLYPALRLPLFLYRRAKDRGIGGPARDRDVKRNLV